MPAITYKDVSKHYQKAGRAAVHNVSLEVEEANLVVLLGPSGCGKTTLLKMTNRLIEPSSGVIEVGGKDIRSVSVTELRRHMGYVIQQVGLFPHLNVAANIATVPKLLGWPGKQIDARTDELLDLVGLPPAQYRKRYPKQLSGGQQQRVGLARALAADPAIMLMDEPFGAIDAITRTHLQDQLVDIQRRVRKTVMFVTHDVDEALKLADKLVIMRDGNIVQYDAPFNILAAPKDDFVRELLNTNDVLRQLSLIAVGTAMLPLNGNRTHSEISADRNMREALSLLIATGESELAVTNGSQEPIGRLTLESIRKCGARGDSAAKDLAGTRS
jgi:osmoprotectant transport system ATP-binding protein